MTLTNRTVRSVPFYETMSCLKMFWKLLRDNVLLKMFWKTACPTRLAWPVGLKSFTQGMQLGVIAYVNFWTYQRNGSTLSMGQNISSGGSDFFAYQCKTSPDNASICRDQLCFDVTLWNVTQSMICSIMTFLDLTHQALGDQFYLQFN